MWGICFCLALIAFAHAKPAATTELQTCSLYLLDVGEQFKEALPRCVAEELVVSYLDQAFAKSDIRLTNKTGVQPHYNSQYSHAYWLVEALKNSSLLVDDIDKADAVFVNDVCYSTFWIGATHSDAQATNLPFEPAEALSKVYKEVAGIPRYQKHGGRDFGIFFPFVWIKEGEHKDLMCGDIKGSLHVTVEAAHCYTCEADARSPQLVIPYASPNFAEDRARRPMTRDNLLFFLGSCAGTDDMDVGHGHHVGLGKKMRGMAIDYLAAHIPPNVKAMVSCTTRMLHHEVRTLMRRSQYCLLLAGDSESSRRLSDIILAGCIPVFLGSPWHNTPLSNFVDYLALGIFIEVIDFENIEGAGRVMLREPRTDTVARNFLDADWWIPTIDIEASAVRMELKDVLGYLLALPKDVKHAKQMAVQTAQPLFEYRTIKDPHKESNGYPQVMDVVVDTLCRQALKSKSI